MKITMSGASGFIGRRLLKLLTTEGHTLHVLSRHAGTNMPGGVKVSTWDPMRGEAPAESLRDVDAVVHLAGEPISQRWNEQVKQRIRDSRVNGTRNLVHALAKLPNRPEVLVCASAVGYYGSRGDETLSEASGPGNDYLADICKAWEQEAIAAEALGIRVVRIRTGVVLDARGGALKRMLPPFRLGLGGKIGSGKQWMSWVHLTDVVNLFRFALTTPVRGAVNGVSPNPVTNADFSKALGKALSRPAVFPVPALGLRLLFGEMSDLLLVSQKAIPEAAQKQGFRFQFPTLDGALSDLLK